MNSILFKLSRKSNSTAAAPAPAPTPLPPFLSIPLSSPTTLDQICTTLSQREHARVALSAHIHAAHHNHRQRDRPSTVASTHELTRPPAQYQYAMVVGLDPKHRKKNRYTDIVAYDRTRVILPTSNDVSTEGKDGEEEEYVNASLVQEPDLGLGNAHVRRWWVAAQAPLPSTLHAFLTLLLTPPQSSFTLSSNILPLPLVSLIIQLTPLREQKKDKCHPYFPNNLEEVWEIPCPRGTNRPIWIKLVEKEVLKKEGRRVSKVRVGWKGQEGNGREVTHVEYLGWGDHGVPNDPTELLTFMRTSNDLNNTLSASTSDPSPILLHCSAGVGRTGTYITISSLLPYLSSLLFPPTLPTPTVPSIPSPLLKSQLKPHQTPLFLLSSYLPSSPSTGELSPYPTSQFSPVIPREIVGETIDSLREQRCTMVQNDVQVRWIFKALVKAWELLQVEDTV